MVFDENVLKDLSEDKLRFFMSHLNPLGAEIMKKEINEFDPKLKSIFDSAQYDKRSKLKKWVYSFFCEEEYDEDIKIFLETHEYPIKELPYAQFLLDDNESDTLFLDRNNLLQRVITSNIDFYHEHRNAEESEAYWRNF